MKKVVTVLSILCFCAMPMLCRADDYGTPVPLDPSLIHGTQGESVKPGSGGSSGNRRNSQIGRSSRGNNKPQSNKPSNRSTSQRSSGLRSK